MSNKGFVRQHESFFTHMHQAIDLTFIVTSIWFFCSVFNQHWDLKYQIGSYTAAILFFFVSRQKQLYQSWRSQGMLTEIKHVTNTWLAVLFIVLSLAFALKISENFSRLVIGSWAIACPTFIIGIRVSARLALRYMRSSGHNFRRIVIAGAGAQGQGLANILARNPWMGISIEGFYDNDQKTGSDIHLNNSATVPVIGNLDKLAFDARTGNYDQIYIALPMKNEPEIQKLVRELANCSVQVNYIPDIFTFNLLNSKIRDLGGIPSISLYDSPLDAMGQTLKRLEDLLIGGIILGIILLPMIIIGLIVKLTSPGPALFKQRRYGLAGEEIWVWKFRSMTVCEDGARATQATKNDSRITRFGAFIRKTSLDELPQFINVIQGTMSIVGPRPHPIALNEQFRESIDGYMLRHMVKPGITGWAQVNGWRGETDTIEKMEKRVEHDLHYVRNWSLWLDIKIIFLTIFKGFIHKNAY